MRANTRELAQSHKCNYTLAMARPKRFEAPRITKAIRISPEVDAALKRIADERQVAINLVITWALEEYIEHAKSVSELRSTG